MFKEIQFAQYLAFSISFVFYSLYAYGNYNEKIRSSSLFLVFVICSALITNIAWALSIKNIKNTNFVFYYALVWDLMIAFTALIVPILFFNLKLSYINILGVFIIVLGLVLVKV
jgi:uncharacterized membrane protein